MSDKKAPNLEETAEYRTNIAGWICKSCRRFYGDEGDSERIARFCCQKDKACDTPACQNRAEKHWIYCDPCREKKEIERWKKLPEVEWDEETPLCLDDDDEYFFSADDLQSYLDERELKPEDVRLVVCVHAEKPTFDITVLMEDYLPDGLEIDDPRKINAIVERWIEKHVPDVWVPGKTRPTLASISNLFQPG